MADERDETPSLSSAVLAGDDPRDPESSSTGASRGSGTDVDRRRFLSGALTLGAAAAVSVPAVASASPGKACGRTLNPQSDGWNTTKDWLCFVDRARSAGVLIGGSSAVVVNSAVVAAIESLFFSDGTTQTPLLKSVAKRFGGVEGQPGADEMQKTIAIQDISESTGCLEVAPGHQKMGRLTKTQRKKQMLRLNGKDHWCPDGSYRSRKIGSHTAHFGVAAADLATKVARSRDVGAVGLIGTVSGPQIKATGSGCGACGTCGVCGACALCGEINVGAATVSLAAVAAISASAGATYLQEAALAPASGSGGNGYAYGGVPDRGYTDAVKEMRRSLDRMVSESSRVAKQGGK
jgi:hypothetical protein